MKRIYLFFIGLLVWGEILAQQLVKVGDGYSSTSVNTTVFRNSSLVTDGEVQYISYYDADGYLTVGKRTLGTTDWTLQRSQYKGNVADAHNVISMMVDGDGYLHLSFDHHGNKLNYCKSTAPGALTLGEKEAMTGKDEDDVTYPEFYACRRVRVESVSDRKRDRCIVNILRSQSKMNKLFVLFQSTQLIKLFFQEILYGFHIMVSHAFNILDTSGIGF